MTSCIVEKNGWMNFFSWLSRFWRMPSATDTVEALQFENAQGDAVVDVQHDVRAFARSPPADSTFTSSAMAKWFFSGCFQSISQTVCVFSPTSGFTFTP